jgi:type II secretory pathway pseudopilin PulG
VDLVHPALSKPPRGSAGFSLIEVLVAAVLLLVILLGIIPLFVRASVNRQAGRESTDAGSFARSRAEALLQLPFDHADVSVPPGSTELVAVEYLRPGSETWTPDASAAPEAQWVRTTRIEQYAAGDLLDGDTDGDGDELDDPRPGGGDPRSIQLKLIEVAVTSPRDAGPFGAAKELTVRVLKAF